MRHGATYFCWARRRGTEREACPLVFAMGLLCEPPDTAATYSHWGSLAGSSLALAGLHVWESLTWAGVGFLSLASCSRAQHRHGPVVLADIQGGVGTSKGLPSLLLLHQLELTGQC
jgi:hypothetical protein